MYRNLRSRMETEQEEGNRGKQGSGCKDEVMKKLKETGMNRLHYKNNRYTVGQQARENGKVRWEEIDVEDGREGGGSGRIEEGVEVEGKGGVADLGERVRVEEEKKRE
ncbi:hypothetical protein Pmani_034053 [Petrolisthes manimaculis]|uniref:Uncharacterized protein n=1 Tax=Petrolisthes manimaculis TaxID=1843537 RepID=A0AAE1TQ40_9EUCA|nr:hypothetical protein Pmani_034053 [Petrolisthes manimaculis]